MRQVVGTAVVTKNPSQALLASFRAKFRKNKSVMCLYTYYSFILFLFQISFQNLRSQCVGRDSSVGIATRYRLDGPGIESRWGGADCPRPGDHPASYTMGTGSILGLKRPECGVDHPPASSAEVKKRVELYLYSHFGPSWPLLLLPQ